MNGTRATHDLLIVGGGMTGLTATLHARQLGLAVACFESGLEGGLLANVGKIEGYPATAPASGAELAAALASEARDFGAEIHAETVTALRIEGDLKRLATESGHFAAKQAIVATGAKLRRLCIPGEAALTGRGVSQCAFCDAGFFRGQDVIVVGGGDAALQEALHLADFARTVTVVHRSSRLRARRRFVMRAADNERFRFRWDAEVSEILGEDGVRGVRLRDLVTDAEEERACTGVFVFIGLTPNSELLPPEVDRDATGHALVDASLETAIPGLYAAGAVRQGYGGQLTQAVGDGTTAARAAAIRADT